MGVLESTRGAANPSVVAALNEIDARVRALLDVMGIGAGEVTLFLAQLSFLGYSIHR